VEYTFDASKIVFHFTADQRVDFRALVRDLAGHFRTRIELRQIGVRDEAKLLGGLGYCGRPFCCTTFMNDFHPVSIKMAKEQGLSLNPSKISGTCGRLMCCLKYEEAAYEDALKDLPKIGSYIDTPDGRGMVTEVNAISKAVKVKLDRRPDAAPQTFQYDAIEGVKRRAVQRDDDPLAVPAARAKPRFEEDEQALPEKPAQAEKAEKSEKRDAGDWRDAYEKRATEDRHGNADDRRGKNWRERHAPRKQEPAYRQPPLQQQQRPQQPPPVQQKAPPAQQAERPQYADAKAVPRYGEVRRANAPQQQNPGGANYQRQPWQKNRDGQQRQGGQKGPKK